jgi:hypothetical protein
MKHLNVAPLLSLLGLVAFAPEARAQSCEQKVGDQFGTYVTLTASAASANIWPPKMPLPQRDDKLECNVKQWKAVGTRVLSSTSGAATVNTSYSYYVGPNAIAVTTTVEGSRTSSSCRCSAQGHITLLAGWLDTITLHSKSMRKVTPNDVKNGPGAQQKDIIHLTVHSRPATASVKDCHSDGQPAFVYQAEFWIILVTPGFGNQLGLGGGQPRQGMGYCSVDASRGEMAALNEFPIVVRMGVSEQLIGSLVTQNDPTAGMSRARREGVSFCIDHPSQPTDLTMTSASGTQYWCTAAAH